MIYLLDTSVLVDLLRRPDSPVKDKIREAGIDNCCISDVTAYELYAGACRAGTGATKRTTEEIEASIRKIDGILSAISIIPSSSAMKYAGKQKAALTDRGETICDLDIIIASTAVVNDLILVTSNEKHQDRLDGVRCDNWREKV